MFLMAHGLSPGGEINMGKRLKPQAFFHNLLPSSSFPLQWSCRASTADSNSKPNPTGLRGIVKKTHAHKHTTEALIEGQMSAMGRRKQTGDKEDSLPFNHLPVKCVSLGSLQEY